MQASRRPFDHQLSLALDRLIILLESRPRPHRAAVLRRQKSKLERRIPARKVRYASR